MRNDHRNVHAEIKLRKRLISHRAFLGMEFAVVLRKMVKMKICQMHL